MANATAAKVKTPRILGPRFIHLIYEGVDDKGTLVGGAIVHSMGELADALQAGKRYTRFQLPERKKRAQAAA